MDLRLEAIKFNHDPDSATRDAFNIRRNETEFVERPEWRRGVSIRPVDSPAAYVIRETRGKTITIKAQFSSTEAAGKTLQVRAVEARAQRRQAFGLGLFDFLLRAILPDRLAPFGNVLGQVKEREIDFNSEGKTGFEEFELQNVRLWSRGVSVSTTEWRWQFRANSGDQWNDFALTRHRVYVVLEIPKCPWQQEPFAETNTQLPWAEALEVACDWAASARNPDQAATLITHSMNDLGLNRVHYVGSPSNYACPNFDCTKFLELLRGQRGMGASVNCSDCATIVSSLSNLVGCDLWQMLLVPNFLTNPIIRIGESSVSNRVFDSHEVAWKGDAVPDARVYDACVQVDGDDDPTNQDFFAPLLPTNLRFGGVDDREYRFRLAGPSANGKPPCEPSPESQQRRKVGIDVVGGCREFDSARLSLLAERHAYDTWRHAELSDYFTMPDDIFTEKSMPTGLQLSFLQNPKTVGFPKITQSLWCFQPSDNDRLIRLDLFQCEDWQSARAFLLRFLGEYQSPDVELLKGPTVGDIGFIEAGEASIVFARSQNVFSVRSVGLRDVSVKEIAVALDHHLISGS